MANDTEIAVILKLIADQFQTELKKSQGLLGEFGTFIASWQAQLTASVGALVAVATSTADYEAGLGRLAQKLGTNAQFLAELQYAARLVRVETDQLSAALGFLDKNVVKAAQGDEAIKRAFQQLGVSITDTAGQIKPLDVLLLEISDRFRAMPDGPVKTGLAMEIMGRSARQILPLMNSDIRASQTEAHQLGQVMSEEMIAAGEAWDQNLVRLHASVTGLRNQVGNALIPTLNALAEALLKVRNVEDKPIGQAFGDMIAARIALAQKGAKTIWETLTSAGMWIVKPEARTETGEQWLASLKAIWSPPTAAGAATGGHGAGQTPDIVQAESHKKTLEARKALLEAEEKLNVARIRAQESHQADWQRLMDADRALFTAKLSFDGEALGYQTVNVHTERDLLAEKLAQQRQYLSDQTALAQTELALMTTNQAQRRAVLEAKTADEAKQAKTSGQKQDIEEAGRLELAALQRTQAAERLPLQTKLQTLALDRQIADLQEQTQTTAITRAVELTKLDHERATVQQETSHAVAMIEERRAEGQLTAAGALAAKIREEADARQQVIEIEERAASLRAVHDADFQRAADALARLKSQHQERALLEARQLAQAQKEEELKAAITVAQSKEDILKLTSFDMGAIAAAHIETLKAQYAKDLQNFQGTEQEKLAYKRLKEVELAQAETLAQGDLWGIYLYGLQQYSTNTLNTFNLSVDMARQTADAMRQGFQTYFFDLMDGKIKTFQDQMRALLDFVKHIISQVLAQLATAAVIRGIGSLGGPDWSGAATGEMGPGSGLIMMNPKHEGGVILPRRFAIGGPVFSNLDSVPALLTPGEGVLSQTGMSALDRLNQGQTPGAGGPVTVNVINSGRTDQPQVNVRRDLTNLVIDVIFRDVRSNGPLRGLLQGN